MKNLGWIFSGVFCVLFIVSFFGAKEEETERKKAEDSIQIIIKLRAQERLRSDSMLKRDSVLQSGLLLALEDIGKDREEHEKIRERLATLPPDSAVMLFLARTGR